MEPVPGALEGEGAGAGGRERTLEGEGAGVGGRERTLEGEGAGVGERERTLEGAGRVKEAGRGTPPQAVMVANMRGMCAYFLCTNCPSTTGHCLPL